MAHYAALYFRYTPPHTPRPGYLTTKIELRLDTGLVGGRLVLIETCASLSMRTTENPGSETTPQRSNPTPMQGLLVAGWPSSKLAPHCRCTAPKTRARKPHHKDQTPHQCRACWWQVGPDRNLRLVVDAQHRKPGPGNRATKTNPRANAGFVGGGVVLIENKAQLREPFRSGPPHRPQTRNQNEYPQHPFHHAKSTPPTTTITTSQPLLPIETKAEIR